MFVPILLLLGRLPTKYAIATGVAVVMGSSIASVCVLLFMYHPFRKNGTPLVSYEIVALLEPALLGGTAIGVLLNASFPSWLIQVLLTIIIIFIIIRTCGYLLPFIKKCCGKKDTTSDANNNNPVTATTKDLQMQATPPIATTNTESVPPTATINTENAPPSTIELPKNEQFTVVDISDHGGEIQPSRSIDNLLSSNSDSNTDNKKLEQKTVQLKELVGEFMQHEASKIYNDMEIEKIEEKKTKIPTPVGIKKYLYRLKRRLPVHKMTVPTVSLIIVFLVALFKGNMNSKCTTSFFSPSNIF